MGLKRTYGSEEDGMTYTDLDLDRGVGMGFHPLCGTELKRLRYDSDRRQWHTRVHFGGWSMEGKAVWYERISGGKSWRVGEPYPSHWKFHPLSGKPLKRRNPMLSVLRALMQTMEAVNRGKGMTFHPIAGKRLSDCGFDVDRGVYIEMKPAVVPEQTFLPPILGRVERIIVHWQEHEPIVEIEHSKSDWRFDPATGNPLDGVLPVLGLWEQG